jgi:hypothetical protein
MSDVVAVALITGGASLVGAGIGAYTTFRISNRNAETTVQTAKQAAEVELEKIRAENERLRAQHQEGERQARKNLYTRLLAALHDLDELAQGTPSTGEVKTSSNRVVLLHSEMLLVAPRNVSDVMSPVIDSLGNIWRTGVAKKQDGDSRPFGARWKEAYQENREDATSKEGKLVAAMYQDISLDSEPSDPPKSET